MSSDAIARAFAAAQAEPIAVEGQAGVFVRIDWERKRVLFGVEDWPACLVLEGDIAIELGEVLGKAGRDCNRGHGDPPE